LRPLRWTELGRETTEKIQRVLR